MWIPVIWVIAAFMTAHVAHERGRSGVAWFFLALLVPVISLLAIIGLPLREKAAVRPPLTPAEVQAYRLRRQRF